MSEVPKLVPPTAQELEQVYYDNVRTHQVGGHQDGITEEVAADLGFKRPNPATTDAIRGYLDQGAKQSEHQPGFITDGITEQKIINKQGRTIGSKFVRADGESERVLQTEHGYGLRRADAISRLILRPARPNSSN